MTREDAIAALKRWQDQIADEFGSEALDEAINLAIDVLEKLENSI